VLLWQTHIAGGGLLFLHGRQIAYSLFVRSNQLRFRFTLQFSIWKYWAFVVFVKWGTGWRENLGFRGLTLIDRFDITEVHLLEVAMEIVIIV
jgi:hypothetical protein